MRGTADWDLVVVGSEAEGCLAAVAAARAGAHTALLISPEHAYGGLLTDGGLAFVDRDSRHLVPPGQAADGLFGEFLARAGVRLVSLQPEKGISTLEAMLSEAGVTVFRDRSLPPILQGERITALPLAQGESLNAHHYLDATPDGDLAEAAGIPFASGFSEYGLSRYLGVSPLPVVKHISPARIMDTCRELAKDPELIQMCREQFGDRRFLDLEAGDDYLLIGPPYLGLAYQRWRDRRNLVSTFPFEADGFNVAIIGPQETSWNGLIYFIDNPNTLLALSRGGCDDFFRQEARTFEQFLQEDLGWTEAQVHLPDGLYVRQTRHALTTRHRLSLNEIASGYDLGSVGTFAYYPDFRGFRVIPVPRPLIAHVILDAGLFAGILNLAIASRSGGYTPMAHSLCRLVQYNVILGCALGVAVASGQDGWSSPDVPAIRRELSRQGILADDQEGLELNEQVRTALERDSLYLQEA